MKNRIFAFGLFSFLALLTMGFTHTGDDGGIKKVSVEKSTINWKGHKITKTHTGTISLKSGELKFNRKGNLTGGSFEMDMTTIANTDLSGGMKSKLEGHLKSDDFFGVETHPVATFVIREAVSKDGKGNYEVTGDLTIKGITHPITFETDVTRDGSQATANIKVDRTKYNVRYGSGKFFENLGDKAIYDNFDLEVNLVID